jgi:pentapeptide MXKDX repeat protein
MRKILAAILCSGVLLSSGAAFADEMAKDSMSKHDQMMKDCMAKQDASKGKKAAMKACKEMLDKDSMSKDDSMSHDKESMPK